MILLAGEITSRAAVDYQKVVRDTIRHIGYDDSSKGTGGPQPPSPKSAFGAAWIPPQTPLGAAQDPQLQNQLLEQHRPPHPLLEQSSDPPNRPLEQHRTPNPRINPWSGTLITSPRLKSAL